MAEAGRARLLAAVAARADPDGFVPFDRFMEVALYGSEVGFYARDARRLGPTGDFYTAAHVHRLFARTVAARALAATGPLAADGPVRWAEIGPGDGTVSAHVAPVLADALGEARLEVDLVDRAPPLLERARTRVAEALGGRAVRLRTATSFAALGPTRGFVFANELFDALPVERFRWTGNGWTQLGVRVRDGRLEPGERPLPAGARPPPEDGRVGRIEEESPLSVALLREVGDHLVEGQFVLIDYGSGTSELRAGHPFGTLAAVRAHRGVDDYLAAAGEVDLSAFVDFDRLRSAAKAAGWAELAFRSQADALVAWGIERLFEEELAAAPDDAAEVKLRLAVKNLLYGFGAFRALELQRARVATGAAVTDRGVAAGS